MIRKLGRPMLASVYIADGVDMLVHTDAHVEGVESVLHRTRALLPRKYARQLPRDPELVTRGVGGVKIGAAALLATGKAPRTAATVLAATEVPTILARYNFWDTQEPEEKTQRRGGFLTHVALLGGLAITSVDTAGKPGLKWRTEKAAAAANKKAHELLPSRNEAEGFVTEAKDWISDNAQKAAETAQAYVEDNKDDWRDSAASLADSITSTVGEYATKAQHFVDDNKDDWLKAAKKNTRTARKRVVKTAAKLQDRAAEQLARAEEATGRQAKQANKRAKALQKQADKALGRARKRLKKIEL